MKLKIITAFIIAINTLLLSADVPLSIATLIFSNLIFSFVVNNQTFRNVIKITLMIGAMVLLRYHFKILLVAECVISFVMILSSLKFWELNEERDHFNMFLILSLAVCCVFLLNPTFLIFLYGIGTMLFYFYYILKIRGYDVGLLNIKRLLLLVTPAVIVSLILFYTFPRFTQGFINSNEIQYMIGGNTKIKFDDLGGLSTSKEPAFRVRGLENSNLPFKLIYWRSSVLWQMSNEEWVSSNISLKSDTIPTAPNKFRYEVESLQNYKEHLLVLDGTSTVTSANLNFHSYQDNTFKLKSVSKLGLSYSVIGTYGDRPQAMSPIMESKGLRLPKKNYERIKERFFSKASHSDKDSERLKELIQIYKNHNFEYSLNPPKYASIEDFLLNGKLGYCSHFATSFTFLARLYGLPSRIITGYLGGQFNPYDTSVLVREMDAHAWVEVYVKEKGWVKVDPTGLVVPSRLVLNTEEFINDLNPYITVFNLRISRELFSFSALNDFSLWIDSINSRFSSNLVNFDRDKQLKILRAFTPKNLSVGWIFALSLFFSLMVMWILFYFYGIKRIHPNERRYQKFLKKMAAYGMKKEHSETILNFQERCLQNIPEQASFVKKEVNHYIDSFYKLNR